MTSPSPEPGNGEVMRRLDEVMRRLDDTVLQLREDRAAVAETFLRKDVYVEGRAEQVRRIDGLEAREAERDRTGDAFRRQMILAVLGVALPAFGALVLAVNNLLTGATP